MLDRFSPPASLLALALAACALAACEPEPLSALKPRVLVQDVDGAAVCADDGVSGCAHDFGSVVVGAEARWSFAVHNPGKAPLTLRAVRVDGSAAYRVVDAAPAVAVATDGFAVVTVAYAPGAVAADRAVVVVESDAENAGVVEVAVAGSGADVGHGHIVVDPGACDFGAVGLGVSVSCTLTLRNDGDADLHLDPLLLQNDSAPDFAIAAPLSTSTLAPGTSTSATVNATPSAFAAVTGTLLVKSDDVDLPVVAVPLTVRGSQAPTAVARIRTINGTAVAPASGQAAAVEPLDDVVVSGDASVAGDSAIVAYRWTLLERPAESSVALSSPDAVDTGFTFDSGAGVVSGVDVAGTFRLGLVVTDAGGATSENEAVVVFTAVPTAGLHVQLSWSTDSNDLDLHLGRGFGIDWCSRDDCYYANCEGASLNWDGAAGQTPGDPSLDIDDTRGFGPENINIDDGGDSYVIGVHAYSGEGNGPGFDATDVTVKVFLGGALVDTFHKTLTARDQFWKVARVDLRGAAPAINVVDTLQDHLASCQ